MRTWAALLLVTGLLAQAPEEAPLLQQLRGGSPAERRLAAERLGEVGGSAAARALARALHDPDSGVRQEAQAALWAIWLRSGNPELDALTRRGMALMAEGRYPEAVAVFTDVIRRAPEFAEGWNKRATVYYLMGDYDRSLADCEEVIRRNPIHFGALSGLGLNYLRKGQLDRAAEFFERALDVNPNLADIEALLEELRGLTSQRRRQAI